MNDTSNPDNVTKDKLVGHFLLTLIRKDLLIGIKNSKHACPFSTDRIVGRGHNLPCVPCYGCESLTIKDIVEGNHVVSLFFLPEQY